MNRDRTLVGWREWISFPGLGIRAIKAKMDTGARTSTIHAFQAKVFEKDGVQMIRFGVHPLQGRKDVRKFCTAEVSDRRMVRDSGGHMEMRYIIRTPVRIGDDEWETEVTLTNRDSMRFRVLVGRNTMAGRLAVDPKASYQTGFSLKRRFMKKLREKGLK